MKIEQERLSNNLNTLFIHSPGSTCATVQIWFRAGSALEDNQDLGIAHFLEHMFFKGTTKRPGAQIAHDVESFGGEINAFTSFDYTCYYINAPNTRIIKTVDILLDMVTDPLFKNEELVPERDVVYEELRRSLDSASQFNFSEIQKHCFTGPYGKPILGTKKTILNFSREQLIKFRELHYNSSNALLVIAGDIKDKQALIDIVENYSLPDGNESSFRKFKLKTKPQNSVHTKEVNQATITLNIQAPEYHSDTGAAEDLALNCLSYGEISPLYKKLVTDTQLATNVSASTMFFNQGGCHFLRMAFPPENLQQVLDSFLKTLKGVLEEGLKEDDILRIKNQYISSKVYEKETIESYAFSLGHGFAQTGDIHCEEEFINKVKQTSRLSVNKALVDIFSRDIHLTTQVPMSAKLAKIQKQLCRFQEKLHQMRQTINNNDLKLDCETSKYDPEVTVVKLKKGVKLVHRKNKLSPTFVFHAYLKGGLAHETISDNGIYHFTSKLLTYGYDKLSFDMLKSDLEKKSAYLHGFSGKNAYGLTLHGLSDHFDSLIKHFEGSLMRPKFEQKFLKIEKELVKRQLHIQKEDPVKTCFTKVNQLVFNHHPYAMDMIGNLQSLPSINRKSVKALHEERLKKSELVFVYCGSDELENVIEKIKPITDSLTARSKEPIPKRRVTPISGQEIHIDFNREQTHIFIGRPGFKVNVQEDLYLKMLTSYLSGQSSELFVDVRDRQGLCYAVQPLHHTALEAGYWGIYIGAGNEKTQLAIEAILGLLEKLQKKGLSKNDFERIKEMIEGQNLLSVQTNDDYANFYAIPTLHQLGLDYQHESFELIRSFKHRDFNNFLKKFLKTDWNIIKVGKGS